MECTKQLRKIFLLFCLMIQVQRSISAVSSCGGTLVGPTGTFTSPNYPHSPKRAPNAAEVRTSLSSKDEDIITCEWKIKVPEDFGIQLNFGDFNMGAGLDECSKGELEVFSGIDENKTSLDKYCGNDDLDRVQLTKNTATVIFRRPKEFSGNGFLVSYIATKPGETKDDFVTCVDQGKDHVGVGSYSVLCAGGCGNITDLSVRGKDPYRDDSFLCKAAVHAGVISDLFGGRIDVRKVPGKMWYMASEANGVVTETGVMSDTMIKFVRPDESCNSLIEFHENQLTASSYWTKDTTGPDKSPNLSEWKPDKAILGKQIEAWSPNNPTTEQWLQVDLRETKVITAISTRGSTKDFYTTKSYRIAYRNDTESPWTFYREEGVGYDKVFVGNKNIFQETRNNFIRPRIVGRFFRVYPTPVRSDDFRYSLQIALYGCDADETEMPVEPILQPVVTPSTTKRTTTLSTTSRVPIETTTMPSLAPDLIRENNKSTSGSPPTNKTLNEKEETVTDGGGVVKSPVAPTDTKKPTINENSIIVIAIVAALAVTSILLAALVLILVRKRKKAPKDGALHPYQMQQIHDNNNTGFQYKNKKSRKRGRKNPGVHIQNEDYKDTLLQVQIPQSTLGIGPSQTVTLPADQTRFISSHPENGSMPAFLRNGIPQNNTFRQPAEESDSFTEDDDDDHEYQVIPDELVVSDAKTPVPSVGRGSSKASTGSSMGNHSRKSDTMQRPWGVDTNQWNKQPQFASNSPVFTPQPHNGIQRNPHMSSFSGSSHPNGVFAYPKGAQLTRAGTFSQGDYPHHQIHPGIRRGSSQSPTHLQRHSSSSNNSAHSYTPNGSSPYSHDPNNPYYSSVPNGEGNVPLGYNHAMYGGPSIPEQNEIPASATRRAPSYKVPRQFDNDKPALPEKIGHSSHHLHNGSDPSIGGRGRSISPTQRSDYDRLYRNNNSGGHVIPDIQNNFSISNGSHSQYNQLDLNGARV
uniref:discoidin, CUB and LCCL domain-containing protein 2-like n=1 Tax=Styela clava TaxID=7725 RepID=UPI0019398A59|nr:discoidin, CUB and LCCL domain-containing protein 2-like [Styela clava]